MTPLILRAFLTLLISTIPSSLFTYDNCDIDNLDSELEYEGSDLCEPSDSDASLPSPRSNPPRVLSPPLMKPLLLCVIHPGDKAPTVQPLELVPLPQNMTRSHYTIGVRI